ncbi:hypothetical protein GCM10022200_24780 [Microbacterium awajiense]|uniref:Uncharacterized protein n=1 Tax=Microbacterium awajiense TaxID=415214 RepID=A0ABP7AU47_9MICO
MVERGADGLTETAGVGVERLQGGRRAEQLDSARARELDHADPARIQIGGGKQ